MSEENEIKDERHGNFFIIDNDLFEKDLTPIQFAVYCVIVRFSGFKNKKSFAGIMTISEKANISKNSVISAIKVLEEKKLITVQRTAGEWYTTEYGKKLYRNPSNTYTVLNVTPSANGEYHSANGELPSAPKGQYQDVCYQNKGVQENIYKPKPKKKTKKTFIPPTLEQVKEYAKERNSNVDPNHFFDFYEAENWSKKGEKMASWKGTFITWDLNNKKWASQNNKSSSPKQNNWLEKERAANDSGVW